MAPCLAAGDLRARIPGFAVKVADTVACGDAFTGEPARPILPEAQRLIFNRREGLLAWLGRRACAAGRASPPRLAWRDGLAADSGRPRRAFLVRRAEPLTPRPVASLQICMTMKHALMRVGRGRGDFEHDCIE